MATQPIDWTRPARRDWRTALASLRKLLANADDTAQVFKIMKALQGNVAERSYKRLLSEPGGGAIAYRREELAERLNDPAWVASFPAGSVGAAYREFLARTGYTAQGLVELSEVEMGGADHEHPYAWMGRRERDLHDIWHVLTGYQADEPLGEACLAAFCYGQTRGMGWLFIAAGAAIKSIRMIGSTAFARAVWEGGRIGRRARWLHAEDAPSLMLEPLAAARARLGLGVTPAYHKARAELARLRATGI